VIDIPSKLKDDPITEVVCELHFEAGQIPEVVIGRLLDVQRWRDYKKVRLPFSDVPEPIRRMDPNLKFSPLFELKTPDGARIVRIGGTSLSYHILQQYCGWSTFKEELEHVIRELFEKIEGINVTRIGFRYINALTEERHYIRDAHALSVKLHVAEQPLKGPVNLNYLSDSSNDHKTLTRIASPDFVTGNFPPDTVVVVDVDVFTNKTFSSSSLDEVLSWINDAHEYEKQAFFTLLPKHAVDKLRDS